MLEVKQENLLVDYLLVHQPQPQRCVLKSFLFDWMILIQLSCTRRNSHKPRRPMEFLWDVSFGSPRPKDLTLFAKTPRSWERKWEELWWWEFREPWRGCVHWNWFRRHGEVCRIKFTGI